jgi:hypothetical protein
MAASSSSSSTPAPTFSGAKMVGKGMKATKKEGGTKSQKDKMHQSLAQYSHNIPNQVTLILQHRNQHIVINGSFKFIIFNPSPNIFSC